MAIPNTTPTPNELYNGEMNKMNDTELRVVLVVTRATFGWEIDKEIGRRKEEDWISRKQLIQKTGAGSRAISMAINSCVKRGWIEVRNSRGELLETPQKRKIAGSKLYYRLVHIFLKNTTTIANNAILPSQLNHQTIATDAL